MSYLACEPIETCSDNNSFLYHQSCMGSIDCERLTLKRRNPALLHESTVSFTSNNCFSISFIDFFPTMWKMSKLDPAGTCMNCCNVAERLLHSLFQYGVREREKLSRVDCRPEARAIDFWTLYLFSIQCDNPQVQTIYLSNDV